jgi:hypothetical protein
MIENLGIKIKISISISFKIIFKIKILEYSKNKIESEIYFFFKYLFSIEKSIPFNSFYSKNSTFKPNSEI